jgi:hypothetical protein
MDRDGYGYGPEDQGVRRLLEDLRTLSPAGIERIAAGWRLLLEGGGGGHERFQAAERAALRALEEAGAAPGWDEVKRELLDLTEGRAPARSHDGAVAGATPLVAWRAEHGETGHHAEAAALGAALALVARGRLSGDDARALVEPAAEALPWLLSAL